MIFFILGEEWKIENESRKIFGEFDGVEVKFVEFRISVMVICVLVLYGYIEVVFVKFEEGSLEEVREVFEFFDLFGEFGFLSYERFFVYFDVF